MKVFWKIRQDSTGNQLIQIPEIILPEIPALPILITEADPITHRLACGIETYLIAILEARYSVLILMHRQL